MATLLAPLEPVAFETDGNSYISEVDFDPFRMQLVTFNESADGTAYYAVRVPKNYAGTPALVLSYVANATTGAMRIIASSAVPADGETMDVTFSAETAVDTTVPATAYLRDEISISITGSTPAVDDLLIVRVARNGVHANDTLAVPLHLLGAWFSFSDS